MSGAVRSAIGGLMLLLAACSLPGRGYPVSPVLHGRITGLEADAATLDLLVASRDTVALAARRKLELSREGDFYFEPIALKVAGREYGHRYRAWLSLQGPDGETRVLWRAEWRREAVGKPVELDCDLGRSSRYGQPCQVERGTGHRWLVELGEREFLHSCASCHGVGATGEGPAAAALSIPPPNLTRIAAR